MKKKIKQIILIIIYFPILLKIRSNREMINEICERWYDVLPINKSTGSYINFINLFRNIREFRDVLYYYLKLKHRNIYRIIYPGMPTLFINPDSKIGKGLVIQHGHSSQISGSIIGQNCQIWQNVTIGKSYSGGGKPKIGSNVKICCNAVVLGDIEIGDNVTIGASSVVIHSIPSNCVVVGNPAKIIKRDGIHVKPPF